MKTIYYNSKLAKLILFGSYHTIMLFGFILSILKEITAETAISVHIINSSSSAWR